MFDKRDMLAYIFTGTLFLFFGVMVFLLIKKTIQAFYATRFQASLK